MRPVLIAVVVLLATLPFAPSAVTFDSLSGLALIIAWGVGCGLVAFGIEHLLRRFLTGRSARDQPER